MKRIVEWAVIVLALTCIAIGLWSTVFAYAQLNKDKLRELAQENAEAVRTYDEKEMDYDGRNRLRATTNALLVVLDELSTVEKRLDLCTMRQYSRER